MFAHDLSEYFMEVGSQLRITQMLIDASVDRMSRAVLFKDLTTSSSLVSLSPNRWINERKYPAQAKSWLFSLRGSFIALHRSLAAPQPEVTRCCLRACRPEYGHEDEEQQEPGLAPTIAGRLSD